MRVAAASVVESGAPTTPTRVSATAPTAHLCLMTSPRTVSGLEGRPDREVDLIRLLPRLLVQVVPDVEPDGTQRREEPYSRAGTVAEVRGIEGHAEPVRVARVEEEGQAKPREHRDQQLGVEHDLLVAADDVPLGVLRRDGPRPLSAERGGAAEEEPLEDRELL